MPKQSHADPKVFNTTFEQIGVFGGDRPALIS